MAREHTSTAKGVMAKLVAAFRDLPGSPIYSPQRNVLHPVIHRQKAVTGLDLIMATTDALGRESTARVQLLTWARERATDGSVSDVCAAHGWPRSTLYWRAHEAAKAVAMWLNFQRQLRRVA